MPGASRCLNAGCISSNGQLTDQQPSGGTNIDRGLWMISMDDAISPLLKAAQRGDENAFGELVKSHYERIYRPTV